MCLPQMLTVNSWGKARVSKGIYRMQVRFPSGNKSDMESAAREYWLNVLVAPFEESELPLVKVAQETSNPAEVMRRAFGTRRMKTLRSRARSWAKVRVWMIMFAGQPFPPDVSYVLGYLLFLVQEEAPKGRLLDTAAALAVLQDAGQVAGDMKISSMVPWVQGVRSRIAELEVNRTEVRKAPPPSVAMLISLEVNVVNVELPEYMRAMSWIILLCTWGCLRLSDLEGLCPRQMSLGTWLAGSAHPHQDDRSWEGSEGDADFHIAAHIFVLEWPLPGNIFHPLLEWPFDASLLADRGSCSGYRQRTT